MSYFDHQQSQQPYQRTFRRRRSETQVYQVDEDGDRIYTEEDYALPQDGDAFLPDEAEDALDESAFPIEEPFSYMGAYDSLQPQAEEELYADADIDLDPEEELLSDEDRAELRRSNWKLAASLADFGGVILGTAAILLLIALLASLMNWLINDVSQTFTLLQMNM